MHRILAKVEGDKQITHEEFSKLLAEVVKNENGGRVMTALGDEMAVLEDALGGMDVDDDGDSCA